MSITRRTPVNRFKQRLAAGEQQIGLWSVLADGYVAELLAGCGYDWLLIDAEHGPNDLRSVLDQLQGIAAAGSLLVDRASELSQPVVRLPHGDPALIKQYLEIGVQNLLIPMVDTPEQAAELVRAVRYPPHGVRGMGSGIGRSSRWGRLTDYVRAAADNICLVVQIETGRALENIEAIAAIDGVDGVFFGPSDLAADLGFPEQRSHPQVVQAIRRGVEAVRRIGTPAGIMLTDVPQLQEWLRQGISFAGVGVDSSLLIRAADDLLAQFRVNHHPAAASVTAY
ncbi:2,4-dihydroxyhept-2-ene-1,7-dioic acid aldolase [Micromonospora sonchi]|uniref:2,4-dihydroxyhept-2-ene-1,7-dioic acid aldolase n=1 Tax=Micromonospora sonchi TaxID=1763543 RepID=A0A917U429_9ACTN|nr:HpcH/HpaI aldolase/citrate lyase family protein [Micromonospora sonchi]GGM56078.1 2,4-dihydroxyhept-2-ene-1,7-dioic acid aldolase [Micromonospora sonchi]